MEACPIFELRIRVRQLRRSAAAGAHRPLAIGASRSRQLVRAACYNLTKE